MRWEFQHDATGDETVLYIGKRSRYGSWGAEGKKVVAHLTGCRIRGVTLVVLSVASSIAILRNTVDVTLLRPRSCLVAVGQGVSFRRDGNEMQTTSLYHALQKFGNRHLGWYVAHYRCRLFKLFLLVLLQF